MKTSIQVTIPSSGWANVQKILEGQSDDPFVSQFNIKELEVQEPIPGKTIIEVSSFCTDTDRAALAFFTLGSIFRQTQDLAQQI